MNAINPSTEKEELCPKAYFPDSGLGFNDGRNHGSNSHGNAARARGS